jgi:hypothetical protein
VKGGHRRKRTELRRFLDNRAARVNAKARHLFKQKQSLKNMVRYYHEKP